MGQLSVTLVNNCAEQTIWPAISSGANADPALDPLPSGAQLQPFQSIELTMPRTWVSGRIWAKQYCDATGAHCRVGGCGSVSCWQQSVAWATLFEITVIDGRASYDLSLGTLRYNDLNRNDNHMMRIPY